MAEEDPQLHASAKREPYSGVNLNEEVQRGSVVPSNRKDDCARKAALLAEVQAAMGALMAIHNDEVAALFREISIRYPNSGRNSRSHGITRPA